MRALPEYRGELYLETHRGTYTTHRDIKSRNAALERALGEAEELCAWCVGVRAPASAIAPLLDDLRTAWTIVLRNQFHDVMAGSAIGAVYADVLHEYERAERIVARVAASARSILPRADLVLAPAVPVAPLADGDDFVFANDYLRARVRRDGTIVELAGVDGRNLAAIANGLMLYVDRPRTYDAWNLDAAYERHPRKLRPGGARIEDDALVVHLSGDGTAIAMRVALGAGEPYLRIELNVNWQAKHRILRAEHRFAVRTDEVRFGMPHGSLVRTAKPQTQAERARFEVPAQRWVHASDGEAGVAILAADSYGWSAHALRNGGVRIGTSLLRCAAVARPVGRSRRASDRLRPRADGRRDGRVRWKPPGATTPNPSACVCSPATIPPCSWSRPSRPTTATASSCACASATVKRGASNCAAADACAARAPSTRASGRSRARRGSTANC